MTANSWSSLHDFKINAVMQWQCSFICELLKRLNVLNFEFLNDRYVFNFKTTTYVLPHFLETT